jgi:hypothetical protein
MISWSSFSIGSMAALFVEAGLAGSGLLVAAREWLVAANAIPSKTIEKNLMRSK